MSARWYLRPYLSRWLKGSVITWKKKGSEKSGKPMSYARRRFQLTRNMSLSEMKSRPTPFTKLPSEEELGTSLDARVNGALKGSGKTRLRICCLSAPV